MVQLKGPHFENRELSYGVQLSPQEGSILSSFHNPHHSLLFPCLHPYPHILPTLGITYLVRWHLKL